MENEKFYEDLCNIARVLPNLTASDIFTELNNLKDNQDRVQVILGKYFSSYEPEEHNCMSDDIKKIKRVVPSYPFIHINNDLVAVENKENRVQMVLKKYFDDKVKTAKRSLLENTDLSQEESSRKKFKSNDDITDSLPEINSVQASTSAEKDQSSSGTESYIVEEFTSEKSNKVESEICNKTTEMVSTENSSDANVQNKINDHCENTNDKCKKTDNCNKDSNETEKPTLLSILSSMFPQHSTKVISTICQELGVNICDKPKDRIVNHVVNALFNYATNEETVERDKTDVYNNESSVTSCNSVQSSENCSTQEYTIDDLQITNTGCAKPIPEDSTQEYGPTDDLEYYFRETVEYLISSITDKVTGDNTVQTSSIKEESLKTDNLLPQNEDLVSDVNLDFSSSTISAISDILEFSPVEDSKYAIPQLFPTLELNEPMETTNTTPFYNNPVPSTSTNSNLNSELNTNINNLSVPVSNASTNILELSKNDLILFSPPNYVTDFTNSGTKFRSDINVANHVLKTNSSASSLEYNRISDVLNFENALLNNRSPNLNSPLSTSTTRTTRFNTKSIAQSTPLVKPAAFQHKPSTVTTTKTSFTSHPSRTKVPWYTGSPRICNPIIKPATFQLRNQLTRINHGLVPSSNMYPIAGIYVPANIAITKSLPCRRHSWPGIPKSNLSEVNSKSLNKLLPNLDEIITTSTVFPKNKIKPKISTKSDNKPLVDKKYNFLHSKKITNSKILTNTNSNKIGTDFKNRVVTSKTMKSSMHGTSSETKISNTKQIIKTNTKTDAAKITTNSIRNTVDKTKNNIETNATQSCSSTNLTKATTRSTSNALYKTKSNNTVPHAGLKLNKTTINQIPNVRSKTKNNTETEATQPCWSTKLTKIKTNPIRTTLTKANNSNAKEIKKILSNIQPRPTIELIKNTAKANNPDQIPNSSSETGINTAEQKIKELDAAIIKLNKIITNRPRNITKSICSTITSSQIVTTPVAGTSSETYEINTPLENETVTKKRFVEGLNAVHTKVTQSFPSTSGIRNGGNNSTHATGKQDINKNTIRVRTDLYDTYFNGPELQSPPMRPEENDDIIFVSHGTLSPKRIVSEDRAIKPVTTSPSIIELISQNCIQSVDNNYFVPTTTNVIKMEEKPIVDVDQPCTSNANENHPYYFKLLEIFPDISPDYLRKLCFKASEKQTLDDLISVLLNGDYNKRNRPASPESHLDFEQQHTILQDLFPDADPTYLQHHCERLIDQPENFKQFVASLLENKNYPTKEEYLKKMKLSAQEKQYTTEFDVKKFLEVIPNPEKFFNDPQRRISYDSFDDTNYAVTFLKNTFCTTAIKDITSVFRKSNFNVLCSAKRLAKLRNMKTKRKPYPVTSCKNIPLLQEIAYVKHKNEIIEYIKKKELENKLAREEAKTAGLMKTCRCCYDDEVMPDDTETCASGEHIFCKDCIRRGCEVVIGDGKLDFPCLETCESFFTLQVLQAVLTPKVFSKMAQRKQMEEVKSAGIEELEFCPFCDFATIPAPGDKVFRCLNDDCMKESCRLCKEPSHIPLRCEEVEKDKDVKMRTYIENKMTEALLRKCYKCGLKFIKESGCNKMTCSCGAMMCYVCNQPVQDYKHFNGQGGDKLHLCPLYSDTHKLHVDAIKRGAESAKKELGVNNDNQLKIDPTADLDHHYKILSAQNPTIPNIPVIFPQDIIRLPHFHQ